MTAYGKNQRAQHIPYGRGLSREDKALLKIVAQKKEARKRQLEGKRRRRPAPKR